MSEPRPSVRQRLRRALLGAPIPNSRAHHERLSPFLGLPVFSSDALSSVAYATEAIMLILIYLSTSALHLQIWISLAIVALIAFVSMSYRQTIHAYPSGGGSYIVASENLGAGPGLVAAAALLIDYILTVAVSVAAGVAAILSAFPTIRQHVPDATVTLSILCIAIVAFANLRGLKESGTLFAIPTYGFVLAMAAVIVAGAWALGHTPVIPFHVESDLIGKEANAMRWFIVLRAFSAGCAALTGIEAVSNGVQAFKAPESKNAAKTLTIMSCLLAFLFLGLGYVALHLPEHYAHFSIHESNSPKYLTLTAQVAAFAFGQNSVGFYTLLIFVALILILAANTAFADFPRLASLIARDGYLPRYLARLGDKLVFHNGIVVLAIAAAALVVVFNGQLDSLLPLYAVGVFTAFTLSQVGMVVHWHKERRPGWLRSAVINGIGATLCFVVTVIIGFTKFLEGAWIVVVLIPMIYVTFIAINRRYASITRQLAVSEPPPDVTGHIALLLVPRVHRGVLSALQYARQMKGEIRAVHVPINEKGIFEVQRQWAIYAPDVALEVLPAPYRSLIQPLTDFVDDLRAKNPNMLITVIVAEAVSTKWYQRLLAENVAQQLKVAMARRPGVIVANPRYFLS
ncbi:APC family permease [Fimbriimonas ginsengisoli]|uniref:Amino acid permease n=1 Tax=Fimbriimonas ginsengisoli Gsoil 348 TaxID=661478 RepID=A0A068NRA7_FIMGI|nr:APC family permease [Fimbriimonas ginsengisoli]AIE84119.1 Amino acid permease [Fimbriimonas ginsengisoli Gsoil 348]